MTRKAFLQKYALRIAVILAMLGLIVYIHKGYMDLSKHFG